MKTRKRRRRISNFWIIILGPVVGFFTGLVGNLVAAWIQNKVLGDAFTPMSITIILGLAAVGLIASIWIAWRQDKSDYNVTSETSTKGIDISKSWFLGAFLKSRGKGVRIKDVKSIGSTFDIDTREEGRDK